MSILALMHGYPDRIGKRFVFAGNYTGPKSYTNTANIATTGDPIQLPGFQNYIDSMSFSSVSVSGTYLVRFRPSGPGPRATWKGVWYTISSGTEVTNTTDLSGETVIVDGHGGVY